MKFGFQDVIALKSQMQREKTCDSDVWGVLKEDLKKKYYCINFMLFLTNQDFANYYFYIEKMQLFKC